MVGVVVTKKSQCVIHSATWDHWDVLKQILQLLWKLIYIPDDFTCTSVQFLKNAQVKQHCDANKGKSLIVSYGSFKGGAFVHGEDRLDTFRTAHVIDGQVPHHVEAFTGTRYSIALYTHPRFVEIDASSLHFLRDLGLKLPPDRANGFPALAPTPALESMGEHLNLLELGGALNVATMVLAAKETIKDHVIIDEGTDALEASKKRCPDAQVAGSTEAWDMQLIQQLYGKCKDEKIVVAVSLCGEEVDVDSIAFLELAVQQKPPDSNMKVIVVANEEAMMHSTFISDLLSTMPFVSKLSYFAPLGGLVYFWVTGDIAWPKGTKSNGYKNECMSIKPPQNLYMEKYPEHLQKSILLGWKVKTGTDFEKDVLHQGVCESEGKETRGLYAGEYERMLGLEVNSSNGISKNQGEKLSEREVRRKDLLARCFPKAVWTFILHSAKLCEGKPLPAAKPP